MTIRGILFDKDGTLVDFFETWIPAYRAAADLAAAAAGNPGLGDQLLRLGGFESATGVLDPYSLLAGGTTQEICELWAVAAGVPDPVSLASDLRQAMERHVVARPVPAASGLRDLFHRLAARGLALGIATMDGEAVARATADALGISDFLKFVSGFDSGYLPKPSPDMAHGFCASVGLQPHEIMVIGDTVRDLRMARTAGAAMAVGVLTGATCHEILAPLADRVVAHVCDIESLLD